MPCSPSSRRRKRDLKIQRSFITKNDKHEGHELTVPFVTPDEFEPPAHSL